MIDILNIIIADDNSILANMMKALIEKDERYKIVGIARNDDDEIKLIDDLRPDLVITDLRKDNKWTGLDIIKRYQKKEYNIEFFIISGSTSNSIKQIEEMNIKYYLNKPYSDTELFRILDEIYKAKYPKAIMQIEKSLVDVNKTQSFFKRLIEKVRNKFL